jgi:hypothetical protein
MVHLHFEIEVNGLGIEDHVPFEEGGDEVDHDEAQQHLRVVIAVKQPRGEVRQYLQEIRLGNVLPQLQELQPNQREVIDVEGTALLYDDVFSGQEEVLHSTVQKDEIQEGLRQIQAEVRSESFILGDDHLSEGDSSHVLLGEEEYVRLVDRLLLLLQLLLLPFVLPVDALYLVRVLLLLVVLEVL